MRTDADRDLTPLEKPLEYLLEPLLVGRRRAARLGQRRRRARAIAIAVALSALVTGSALAAISYLGQPAPPAVKEAFSEDNAAKEAFQDLPSHVPLVDVRTARTVAVSHESVLYGAQGASGNYCTVLVRNGHSTRTPPVQCEVGVYPRTLRVEYKQVVPAREAAAPLVLSGRLSAAGRTLAVRYANGIADTVPVGLRGYFVYQPAAGLQRFAKTNPLRLVERNRAETITDTEILQPPIIVAKSSASSPRLIKGRLFVRGARYVGVTLEVFGSDGSSAQRGPARFVPVGRDGRFTWHAPKPAPRHFDVVLRVLDSRFGVLLDLGL